MTPHWLTTMAWAAAALFWSLGHLSNIEAGESEYGTVDELRRRLVAISYFIGGAWFAWLGIP